MSTSIRETVQIKLDNSYLCADLQCRTISNLHVCPACSSQTFSLARVLGVVLNTAVAA
jgi:hypothetical protein